MLFRSVKIDDKFNKRQIELLKQINVNIYVDFNDKTLEQLEDAVYDAMMDNLDDKQDFTSLAEEYESILDIIVEIENNL